MRRILIICACLLSGVLFAQKGSQEVSLDVADALIMKTLELNYEYYVSEQNALGISGLLNFEKESADFRYNEKSMITPYFRHYFTTARKWNYFGEFFIGINSGKVKEKEGDVEQEKKYTDGALGASVGIKYLSEGGFTIIGLAGVGRNMFGDVAPLIVPRAGLSIGYRF